MNQCLKNWDEERKEKAVVSNLCTMVFHVTSTSYFMVCIHAALWHINNNDTVLLPRLPPVRITHKNWPAAKALLHPIIV